MTANKRDGLTTMQCHNKWQLQIDVYIKYILYSLMKTKYIKSRIFLRFKKWERVKRLLVTLRSNYYDHLEIILSSNYINLGAFEHAYHACTNVKYNLIFD